MIRIIAIVSMILMPIISVSTGTNDQEAVIRSLDLVDQNGDPGTTGMVGDPFSKTETVTKGD